MRNIKKSPGLGVFLKKDEVTKLTGIMTLTGLLVLTPRVNRVKSRNKLSHDNLVRIRLSAASRQISISTQARPDLTRRSNNKVSSSQEFNASAHSIGVCISGFHLSNTILPPRPILPRELNVRPARPFSIEEPGGLILAAANFSGSRGLVNRRSGSFGSYSKPIRAKSEEIKKKHQKSRQAPICGAIQVGHVDVSTLALASCFQQTPSLALSQRSTANGVDS
uniref:Uncharacterized protein n=1 Tax=Solanum lycopersicum TaxID=4081 RepID=A0A3Q7EX47_SOLLC